MDEAALKKQVEAALQSRAIKKANNEWYNLRPILGNAN